MTPSATPAAVATLLPTTTVGSFPKPLSFSPHIFRRLFLHRSSIPANLQTVGSLDVKCTKCRIARCRFSYTAC